MYIDSNKKLQKLCADLRKTKIIYFDTEFMRERSYYPRLCLIQVGYGKKQAAIDPLVDLDLKPLLRILTSKTKLLVFHSGRQDLEILFNETEKLPGKIFDTQIAAMVSGMGDQISYAELVDRVCKKKIDKSQRFTDWAKRPLKKSQIEYALDDVVHLPKIHKYLEGELKKQKREKWLKAETEALLDTKTYDEDLSEVWRKIKHKGKKTADLGVLQELAKWREQTARKKDKPRKFIIKDESLVELAIQQPKTTQAIEKFRNIGNVSRETSKQLLDAIKRGRKMAESKKPKLKPRPKNRADSGVADMLKILLKKTCDENKVSSRLIATSRDIEAFIMGEEVAFLKGWRYEMFGKKAKGLLEGEISFKVSKGRVVVAKVKVKPEPEKRPKPPALKKLKASR